MSEADEKSAPHYASSGTKKQRYFWKPEEWNYFVKDVSHRLRKKSGCKRTTIAASAFLAGVVEYLMSEILELGGNSARDRKRGHIVPLDIQLAVSCDEELFGLYKNVFWPTTS